MKQLNKLKSREQELRVQIRLLKRIVRLAEDLNKHGLNKVAMHVYGAYVALKKRGSR